MSGKLFVFSLYDFYISFYNLNIILSKFQEVIDESDGCGGKFSCLVVSEKFKGKPLLQRHRYVVELFQ